MTATVTPPAIVDKFDDVAPVSGDNLTRLTYGLLDIRKPAGQLWERVAERNREVTDTYASERFLNAWYRPRVHMNDLARMTGGHYYAKANVSTKRSGIIRAGERIK